MLHAASGGPALAHLALGPSEPETRLGMSRPQRPGVLVVLMQQLVLFLPRQAQRPRRCRLGATCYMIHTTYATAAPAPMATAAVAVVRLSSAASLSSPPDVDYYRTDRCGHPFAHHSVLRRPTGHGAKGIISTVAPSASYLGPCACDVVAAAMFCCLCPRICFTCSSLAAAAGEESRVVGVREKERDREREGTSTTHTHKQATTCPLATAA